LVLSNSYLMMFAHPIPFPEADCTSLSNYVGFFFMFLSLKRFNMKQILNAID
jgi:hypothetical protein